MSNIEYLDSQESLLGTICLRQRELLARPGTIVHEITLDHALLMSSINTASEEALAARAVELHGGEDLRVLVGGLGLGYTAAAVLASERVADLEVVEFLPAVVGWVAEGRVPLSASLNGDSRLRVAEGDVYAKLWDAPGPSWDLVLVDVDHSPDEPLGEESERFYSAEGLERTRAHLSPDGVLGVWSYAPSPPFAELLARIFAKVWVEPVRFDNPVTDEEETNYLFFARR